MGFREKKKVKTRKLISDLATRLFIEKGYDAVTVAEIAERAEVGLTTLFNYFPTKESMAFDEDEDLERELLEAVSNRKKGATVLEALESHFQNLISEETKEMVKGRKAFLQLMNSAPELSRAYRELWSRHEQSLSHLILIESRQRLSKIEADAVAHHAIDAYVRALDSSNPSAVLKVLFRSLKGGWDQK